MNMKIARIERTGWRDDKLRDIQEKYGIKTYDFLVSEYDHGKSVAIINYISKNNKYEGPDWTLINYCRKRKNKEYYFTVQYDYKIVHGKIIMEKFIIYPENYYAKNKFGNKPIKTNEKGFIAFLYDIRNRKYTLNEIEALASNISVLTTYPYKDSDIISIRHRAYGWNVPCVDIDSIISINENPYLFIEYKEITSNYKITSGYADKAIADLGNCKNEISVLLVRYELKNKEEFYIDDAFNESAKNIVRNLKTRKMAPEDYFKYILKEIKRVA